VGKILAISLAMPPLLAPRSLQVARTLQHLGTLGWECTVVAVDGDSLRDDTFFADPDLGLIYRDAFQTVRTRTPERSRAFQWLRRLIFKVGMPGAQAFRGGKALWIPSAVRAGKNILGGGQFSLIISFATPWASHVVGRALSRASGLPWVAHFSDPWSDSPYFHGGPFSRWLLDRLQAQVIREADLVVFVTERTRELVMRKHPPKWQRKARVIPPGYDAELLSVEAAREPPARLRLVHAGAFYEPRTPESVLKALATLNLRKPLRDRLEVIFIGPKEQRYECMAARLGLREIVQFAGPAPYLETLRASAEAHVCVVIDAPTDVESVFLPSKIVDYLMLRKPILGVTPLRGESADLLRQVGCLPVAPDDVSGIADAIDGLLGAFETKSLQISPGYERVASAYDVRTTSRRFDAALREVCQGAAVSEARASSAPG
jgi:glycosyltransferase involved in cell wall biosynthesis